MPQHKSPSTLYNISCKILNNLIENACFSLLNRYGPYNSNNNELLKHEILNFQQYLVTSLPTTVIDDVFNTKISGCSLDFYWRFNGDLRILLSLVMHEKMQIFKLKCIDVPKAFTTKIDENFWITNLYKMSKLVILDLSLVCTDEILEVVGNCCNLLEEITCVSKMTTSIKGGNFNALRKMYHVSDEGLKNLTKCEKLKQIKLNASNRSGLGNITEKGISMLISNLPKLKYINYEYMGSVLIHLISIDKNNHLNLCQLKDYRSNPNNITIINQLCPHLTILHIALPTNLIDNDRQQQSQIIQNKLSESCFKLEQLHQKFMHITNELLLELLINKGNNLTRISFGYGCSNLDINSLIIIGKNCPNLIYLQIYTMGPASINNKLSITNNTIYYKKLKCLDLIGKSDWDIKNSLKICLSGGNVSYIHLTSPTILLDDTFNKLLQLNYLNKLISLTLDKHCFISNNIVWLILKNCCHFNYLYCLLHNQLTFEDSEMFKNYIHQNNFDVKLVFTDGIN